MFTLQVVKIRYQLDRYFIYLQYNELTYLFALIVLKFVVPDNGQKHLYVITSIKPKLHKKTYPRPLPDNTSNSVALVKERVVGGREARVFKQQATLQALPLQGGVLLSLKGLH